MRPSIGTLRTNTVRTPVLSVAYPQVVRGHSCLALRYAQFWDRGRTSRSPWGWQGSSGGWRYGWCAGFLHLMRQHCMAEIARKKLWFHLYFVVAFSFYLLSHFNRTGLFVIAFSFYLLSHFDKTGLFVVAFSFYLLSHFDNTGLFVVAFSFYLLSHFDKTRLFVVAFSFYLLSHFDRTGLYVTAFSFCYLIVMNITASSVLSY